jgi:hypothetical protein
MANNLFAIARRYELANAEIWIGGIETWNKTIRRRPNHEKSERRCVEIDCDPPAASHGICDGNRLSRLHSSS